MHLKLEQIPRRVLEIEKPDGGLVQLVLKRFMMRDLPEFEESVNALELKRRMGEIDTREYYNDMISLVVEEFNPEDFDDIDLENIELISEKLKEVRKNKEPAEKKSPGK